MAKFWILCVISPFGNATNSNCKQELPLLWCLRSQHGLELSHRCLGLRSGPHKSVEKKRKHAFSWTTSQSIPCYFKSSDSYSQSSKSFKGQWTQFYVYLDNVQGFSDLGQKFLMTKINEMLSSSTLFFFPNWYQPQNAT